MLLGFAMQLIQGLGYFYRQAGLYVMAVWCCLALPLCLAALVALLFYAATQQ